MCRYCCADSKLGSTTFPPLLYDPQPVGRQVWYGLHTGKLDNIASEGSSLVYTYKYDEGCGGNTYQVPRSEAKFDPNPCA